MNKLKASGVHINFTCFYWKYATYCFLFGKVRKMNLKLLNNSKESVNHAFFKKTKCKTCFNAGKSLTLISYTASCTWPDERAPESRCKVSIRSAKRRLHTKKSILRNFSSGSRPLPTYSERDAPHIYDT